MSAAADSVDDAVAFGTLLRRLRLAAGLTHEALADAAGLSVRGISDLERGLSHRPQRETVRRLAEALGLGPEQRTYFEAGARGHISTSGAGSDLAGTTTLPAGLTPLVGRSADIVAVQAVLADPTVRHVTLTGPGGVGKTRLALQVARELQERYAGGVHVVSLAPLRSPDAVAEGIARTLGLRESLGTSWQQQLYAALGGAARLLVLDNFEHLLLAAPLVSELLLACPHLQVLLTSRARLRLSGEHEIVVAPLALPNLLFLPSPETLAEMPAVTLFLQRARAVDASFALTGDNAAAVAELCVRLDGLPLAIELAAVRTKLLTPAAMLARLDRRLHLLTGGAQDLPARQQTLRNTLDWSYGLLDAQAQRWFRQLSVFVGGWTLAAAARVCGDAAALDAAELAALDALTTLQDTSLIQRVADGQHEADGAGEPRFNMLETVYAYAREQLDAAEETEATCRRHAEYIVLLAEQAEPIWSRGERAGWFAQLESELENLRAALRWSLGGGDPALGLRLTGALAWLWEQKLQGAESRAWCEEALRRNPTLRHTTAGMQTLFSAGALAWLQGDHAAARAALEECITIAERLGESHTRGTALHRLGVLDLEQGRLRAAQDRFTESIRLLRALGDRSSLPLALFCLGDSLAPTDPAAARVLYDETAAIARRTGDSFALGAVLLTLGQLEAEAGQLHVARVLQEEALVLRRALGDRWGLGIGLVSFGDVLRRQGAYAEARTHAQEGLELFQQLGSKDQLPWTWHTLGAIALGEGDATAAAAAFGAALPLRHEQGNVTKLALTIRAVAALALRVDRVEDAARLCGAVSEFVNDGSAFVAASDRRDFEATLAAIKQRLPDVAFAVSWTEGRSMLLDEAVTLAEVLISNVL